MHLAIVARLLLLPLSTIESPRKNAAGTTILGGNFISPQPIQQQRLSVQINNARTRFIFKFPTYGFTTSNSALYNSVDFRKMTNYARTINAEINQIS